MKKLALICCLIIGLAPFYTAPSSVRTDALAAPVYGLIKDNAVLYNSTALTPVTTLPATYFVVIDGETETHYSVTYAGNLSGTVEKNYIDKVDYEPKTKAAAFNFTATNGGQSVPIYSSTDETAVASTVKIPSGEKAFLYGSASGRELAPITGTTWYYIQYNGVSGYVYWAHGSADPFTANVIEKVEPATSPSDPSTGGGSFSVEWLYILMLCIPATVMMLALFSRKKRTD